MGLLYGLHVTDLGPYRAIRAHWMPRLATFQPELILISAGFDAHVEDDMASLNLLEQDFAWVTREITVRDLLVHRSGLGLGQGDLLGWPPSTRRWSKTTSSSWA